MLKRIDRLFSQRQILKNIVLKEIRAKYAGSLLGIFWALITPLLITIAVSFIFTKIMRMDIKHFPLFVLSAILPWMCFSASLFDATNSIVKNSHLLNQFVISREILPISAVLANFINFSFGLVVMLPIFMVFKIQITPLLLLLPFVIFLHLLFTVGIGLFLSCVNVFFRDVSNLLEVSLMFWIWMTPIFYSIDMVPLNFRWIFALNPMTSYIEMYRNILFEARIPNIGMIFITCGMSLSALIAGYVIFIKNEVGFLKKI